MTAPRPLLLLRLLPPSFRPVSLPPLLPSGPLVLLQLMLLPSGASSVVLLLALLRMPLALKWKPCTPSEAFPGWPLAAAVDRAGKEETGALGM